MLFDFENFTTRVKLAYRRVGHCAYSLEDVLGVFRYYFETFEYLLEEVHPMISIDQIERIIDKMPYLIGEEERNSSIFDIAPEQYKTIIEQHFITNYRRCDYNINHFFSGRIRDLRFYETCY